MNEPLPLDRRTLDRARLSRDARFDGRFFIGVTSTGVYCRPVCPAPSPKSAHVEYYASAAAAQEAGFRPCLRCRPEAAPGTPAWMGTSAVVRRALGLIQDGALDESSIEAFAERVGIGARHLNRLFVRHLGASPLAVAHTRRLHFAKRLIDETRLPITQIALASGFGSLRRFNDAFIKAYARAPREIRRRSETVRAGAKDAIVLRLAYRPPYDWPHLIAFLAARAIPGLERADQRSYARTVALADGAATVTVQPVEGRNELELTVRGAAPAALFRLSVGARRVFDLGADPALIRAAFGGDPILGPLVRRRPGLRIPGMWDAFECAVRAILGQQVSVAAARTLAQRLVERAGAEVSLPDARLTHLFPSPAALAGTDLSGLGLTGARIASIQALARAVLERKLAFDVPPEQAIAALQALPGIGAWTGQYIALRALAEPDALPAADLVLRRIAAGAGAPLTTPALERIAERWRPWRSYAVMHLWAAAGEPPARARSTLSHSRTEVLT